MTLANLQIFLKNAKEANRDDEVKMLEERIAKRMLLPQYANLVKEEVKPKEVKKSGKN